MDDVDQVVTAIKKIETDLAGPIRILQAQFQEMEQKLDARRRAGSVQGVGDGKGLHDLITKSEALAAIKAGNTKNARIPLPAGTMSAKAMTSSAGISQVQYVDGLIGMPRRRLTIRDLLLTLPLDSGSVSYVRQSSRAIAAAPVAEGALKPQSEFVLEPVVAPVVTLAHTTKASVQILADVPQLQAFLESELIYGLKLVEEIQLLNGSGVGLNLHGLNLLANPLGDSTGTLIDRIRKSIAQLDASGFDADGIVLSPIDWAAIELAKDANGNYIVGSPRGANPPSLWGRPVIPTPGMTVGNFLIGQFARCGFVGDREQAHIDLGLENDDFTRNLLTVRCEERIALAITQPLALVKGTAS